MRLLPANQRLSRWQIVVAVACSVLFVGFLYERHREPPIHNFRGKPPKINDLPDDGVSLDSITGLGSIDPNAHALPDADAFLPHFKAVISASNITVIEANSTCHWGTEEASKNINFEKAAGHEWTKFNPPEAEVQLHRRLWHHFVAHEMIPYAPHKDRFKGRGIVIVAGNEYTLTRARTVLRALKRLGSKLPIEVHYWGEEMNQRKMDRILELYPNAYFNDLAHSDNVFAAKWLTTANYQYKTAAIVNSRFAEILLLDSDNIPTIDPEELFESETYKKYGTLFWPDITRTRPNNPAWAITNTACRENEYEGESGQLVVDKRRYFYHLQLSAWWSNVHGAYYTKILLGDKDMFRFAWHALKTKYGFPPKWLTSVGTLHDGFYCGHTFAQHHPDGRVAFMHGGFLKTYPTPVLEWYRKQEGGAGVYQVYQRSRFDEQHQQNEKIEFVFDGNFWLPNRPEDMRASFCLRMAGVEPKPLDEIAPGFGKIFDEVGGYWLLDEPPPK